MHVAIDVDMNLNDETLFSQTEKSESRNRTLHWSVWFETLYPWCLLWKCHSLRSTWWVISCGKHDGAVQAIQTNSHLGSSIPCLYSPQIPLLYRHRSFIPHGGHKDVGGRQPIWKKCPVWQKCNGQPTCACAAADTGGRGGMVYRVVALKSRRDVTS